MRLIDADALAKFIDYGHLNNPNEKLYSENDIREMIDDAPTVDAVQVVRCKDCMHFILSDGFCTLHESCVSSDAFCSYGERGSE